MAELLFDARNVVGESLVWDDRTGRLVWVDIVGRRIHALEPATGMHESWQTPGRVTSVGLRDDGGAIVGLEREIALWDWGEGFQPVCEVEPDAPANRLNEGVVGPDGAFWVGTMQNNIAQDDSPIDLTEDAGRLYRYTAERGLSQVTSDAFGITNTLVWPVPGCLVTADTTKNALYAYDMAPETGQLSGRRTILEGFDRGLPDGSCVDAEGHIWTARVVGGACLTCITLAGELLRTVDLPCSWPTSCTFGGPDLDTLYVTSARFTMSEAHLVQNPQEGGLFAIRPGVAGLPEYRFGPQAAA